MDDKDLPVRDKWNRPMETMPALEGAWTRPLLKFPYQPKAVI